MKHSPLENPLVWIAIIAITIVLLWVASLTLWLALPMILAGLIYYLLSPAVDHLEGRGLSHGIAVWVTVIAMILVSIVVMPFVLPSATVFTAALSTDVPRYVEGGFNMVSSFLQMLDEKFFWGQSMSLAEKWDALRVDMVATLIKKHLASVLLVTASWIIPLLLVPFLAFFFLKDGDLFKKRLMRVVPNAYFEKTLLLLYRTDQQIKKYFQGMLWWTMAVSALLGVGLWMLDVPNAFALAFLASIIAWVPYVGAVVGCLIIVLVAATDMPNFPQAPYLVIGLFVAVRLIDDFFIIPATVGRSLNVHPLPTVLVIFLGGEIAGVTGMFLAMPVLGIVTVITEVLLGILTDRRLMLRHRRACQMRLKAQAQLGQDDS